MGIHRGTRDAFRSIAAPFYRRGTRGDVISAQFDVPASSDLSVGAFAAIGPIDAGVIERTSDDGKVDDSVAVAINSCFAVHFGIDLNERGAGTRLIFVVVVRSEQEVA